MRANRPGPIDVVDDHIGGLTGLGDRPASKDISIECIDRSSSQKYSQGDTSIVISNTT